MYENMDRLDVGMGGVVVADPTPIEARVAARLWDEIEAAEIRDDEFRFTAAGKAAYDWLDFWTE